MTHFSMILLGLLGIYGMVAYYRARKYPTVKGNQQHKHWRESAKERRKLKKLKGIDLDLRTLYGSQKD